NAAAEFNWWADPDAAQICVRSAWGDVNSESYKTYGNQMISGLEANQNSGGMPQDLYEKMLENTWPGLRELFEKNNGNTAPDMIWDVFTVAYLIDPTVVLSWNNQPIPENGEAEDIHGVYIDVNTEMTQDYGRSLAYSATKGPAGSKKAAIQNYIDEDKFWNEIVYPALVP
ncbi:MAG: nucleoside hydrolase, partial [Spirochaetales bacterium]